MQRARRSEVRPPLPIVRVTWDTLSLDVPWSCDTLHNCCTERWCADVFDACPYVHTHRHAKKNPRRWTLAVETFHGNVRTPLPPPIGPSRQENTHAGETAALPGPWPTSEGITAATGGGEQRGVHEAAPPQWASTWSNYNQLAASYHYGCFFFSVIIKLQQLMINSDNYEEGTSLFPDIHGRRCSSRSSSLFT